MSVPVPDPVPVSGTVSVSVPVPCLCVPVSVSVRLCLCLCVLLQRALRWVAERHGAGLFTNFCGRLPSVGNDGSVGLSNRRGVMTDRLPSREVRHFTLDLKGWVPSCSLTVVAVRRESLAAAGPDQVRSAGVPYSSSIPYYVLNCVLGDRAPFPSLSTLSWTPAERRTKTDTGPTGLPHILF